MQTALPPLVPLLVVAYAVAVLAAAAGIGYWVYRDASLRGSRSPIAWAVTAVTPFTGLIVLVLYLLTREDIGERTEPRSRVETVCLSLYLGLVAAFVVGALLSPPDPFSQLFYHVPALVVTVPAAYVVLEGVPDRLTGST